MNIKMDTHTIIKKDDAEKYLTPQERAQIGILLGKIADGRVRDSKSPFNHYYICNIDEPYSNIVKESILNGEKKKVELAEKTAMVSIGDRVICNLGRKFPGTIVEEAGVLYVKRDNAELIPLGDCDIELLL